MNVDLSVLTISATKPKGKPAAMLAEMGITIVPIKEDEGNVDRYILSKRLVIERRTGSGFLRGIMDKTLFLIANPSLRSRTGFKFSFCNLQFAITRTLHLIHYRIISSTLVASNLLHSNLHIQSSFSKSWGEKSHQDDGRKLLLVFRQNDENVDGFLWNGLSKNRLLLEH